MAEGQDAFAVEGGLDAVRESAARYRAILDVAAEGVLVADTGTGRFTYANPAICRMLGYTEEELRRLSMADVHPPTALGRVEAELQSHAPRERAFAPCMPCLRKDGSVLYADISTTPMAVGGRPHNVAFFTDVTERRQLEEQLRQSQKLEAIGHLAGGIAHDFNNLLMVLMGYCDLMKERLGAGDPLAADLARIEGCAKRATALTRQLLAFSRKQTLRPTVLDLNRVVGDLGDMLRRVIGEDIALVTTLPGDLGRVKADRGQIEQVIMNMAVNARDAMPRGGMLTIETRNVEISEAEAGSHLGVVPGQYVVLAITDTGCGMDEATKGRLFEPFFTTKLQGTGLGLSTAYGIVKQSGGCIRVRSQPGKGASFRIYLPRTEEEPVAAPMPEERAGPRGGGEQLLVVEDEPALLDLFEATLSELGYCVTAAANGAEAVRAVEAAGLRPDLLVTDIVMPGMTGLALAERLRKSLPGLKVLFMSGYTDRAMARGSLLDAGTPFLQKPFDIAELASEVRGILGKGQKRGHSPFRPPGGAEGCSAEKENVPFSARVLMVDDEEDVLELVRRACRRRGHDFVGVSSAPAALDALGAGKFDVLLVDMNIPGTSGARLLREVRAAGHSLPAIVLSGSAESADAGALRALGVAGVLEKSADLLGLMQAVEDLRERGHSASRPQRGRRRPLRGKAECPPGAP